MLPSTMDYTTLAQDGGKISPRVGRGGRGPGTDENPTVTIVSPTGGSELETTDASIQVCVVAEDLDGDGIASVTWTNDAGGSGVALPNGQGQYCVAAGVEDTIVLSDDFSSVANVDLATLTPPIGMAWSTLYADFSSYCQNMAVGNVRPGVAAGNSRVMCEATPSQALAGTDYTIGFRVGASGIGGDGDAKGPFFGGTDSNTWCGLGVFYGAEATGDDVRLFRWAAGVRTAIASVDVGPASLDAFTLVKSGTNVSVTRNGTQIIAPTSVGANCEGAKFGMFFGSGPSAGNDMSQSTNLDDFTMTDNGDTEAGIVLQVGPNRLTFTATDGASNTGVDTLDVTRVMTDDIDPVIQFTSPTSSTTWPTSDINLDFAGSTSDNVGTVNVTWTCTNGVNACSPTSGTATRTSGTAAAWLTWGITDLVTGVGKNVIAVTAVDDEGNDTIVSLEVQTDITDVTPPVTTITSPTSGASYTSPTATLTVGGTLTDNVGLKSPVAVVCVNSLGGSVNATGAGSWTAVNIPLFNSTMNVITCTGTDTNNNTHADSFTVTYAQALSISTTSPLVSGADDVAYGPAGMGVTLVAVGGTAPYTWTQSVTLASDADCAGLSYADVGATALVSGTPTAPVMSSVTCTFTARVTDAVAATTTQAYTITINEAGSEGLHDFFNEMISSPPTGTCGWALSGRPDPGVSTSAVATCAGAYNKDQLKKNAAGVAGYAGGQNIDTYYMTYDPAGDTDPHAQDAAKSRIPPFSEDNALFTTATLTSNINDSQVIFDVTTASNCSAFAGSGVPRRSWKIDNEIMLVGSSNGTTICVDNGPTLTVQFTSRGMYGTTAASHTAGTRAFYSLNNHPRNVTYALGAGVAETLSGTVDDTDYLFVIDSYHTDSYAFNGLGNNKFWNLRARNAIWFEPGTQFGGSGGEAAAYCNLPAQTATIVYGPSSRSYNSVQAGNVTDWNLTNGVTMGPGYTNANPIVPQDAFTCVNYNEWARWFIRVKQRSAAQGGWDKIDIWVSTEDQAAVRLHEDFWASLGPGETDAITSFHAQLGTSSDGFVRGTVGGNPEGLRDLVMYWRNLVILKSAMGNDAFSDANMNAYYLPRLPVGD